MLKGSGSQNVAVREVLWGARKTTGGLGFCATWSKSRTFTTPIATTAANREMLRHVVAFLIPPGFADSSVSFRACRAKLLIFFRISSRFTTHNP
jgi:hypothetical protein